MGAPRDQRLACLVRESMTLVHADDAGTATADVPEYGLNHFQPDAEPLQAGGDGAAEIV